jgi:putative hydrolase of HD superfamily
VENDKAQNNDLELALLAQRQLDAYNAKDIDAIMACFASDCRLYEFPDRLLCEGAVAIRERHIARFREPDLHAKLLHRCVVGNIVVDQERVLRTLPQGRAEVDVVAIYEIEGGVISKAWFKMGQPRLR